MPSFISLYKLSSPGVGSLCRYRVGQCRWSLGGSFTSRCGLLDWFLSSSLVGHIIYTHTLLRSLYCFIKARNHAQSRVDKFCRSLSATATAKHNANGSDFKFELLPLAPNFRVLGLAEDGLLSVLQIFVASNHLEGFTCALGFP